MDTPTFRLPYVLTCTILHNSKKADLEKSKSGYFQQVFAEANKIESLSGFSGRNHEGRGCEWEATVRISELWVWYSSGSSTPYAQLGVIARIQFHEE